jgi:hypothetical protein
MPPKREENLFSRLTRLFRSGPVIRRKIKGPDPGPTASSAYSLFRRNVSDVYSSTVSAYGQFDRMSRYSDFSEMEATPEIASALDIYAEETASQDESGKVLHIYSENKVIKDLLDNLFYDVINVDFNLPMWIRNLCKYGDFFTFNDISPNYGIVNVLPIPIAEMEREEGFDPDNPMSVRFRWITKGNKVLENWQVTHFRLLGNDAFLPYGASVIESARRIWRQLILIEDAMLVYRIVRAPERRIFYIDVGNIPPEDIENYMQQAQTSLKRNRVTDKSNGKTDLRYNPLSVDDDYYIPVRGSETGTKIDTLAGGQNTAAVEDVQYIQKKLFAALKIPKAYLGYDEAIGSKATLSQEDVRFSRTITRIQKVVLSELNKLAMIHLYSHGISDDEIMNFRLSLNNPSSVAQLQKLELIKTKFDIAGAAPEGAVDRAWIRKNILGLTNEEIERVKEGRKQDKLEDKEVEAAAEGTPEGGASAEPPGGGGGGGGAPPEAGAEAPPESAPEGGSEEPESGGEEDLFAGDSPEEPIIREDDFELPIKLSHEARGVFNNRRKLGRKRNSRASNSKADIPDFKTMTLDSRPQSTRNDPFSFRDTLKTEADQEEEFGTSLVEEIFGKSTVTNPPRMTTDLASGLKKLGTKISRNSSINTLLSEERLLLDEESEGE